MSDLIAASDLKTYLQIAAATATWDTVLAALATEVSRAIEVYCDEEFTDTTRTEYYDGLASSVLIPDHKPIISVTSIHDDTDRSFGASTLVAATDYYLDTRNHVIRMLRGLTLTDGVGNVKLIYRTGWAGNAFPSDLVLAAKIIGAFYYNRRKSEGRTNESMGNLSLSHAQDWPADAKAILRRYKRQGAA